MYIETSRPRLEGDKARLLSPTFNMNSKSFLSNNPTYCFTCYYHMYGKHIGESAEGWGLSRKEEFILRGGVYHIRVEFIIRGWSLSFKHNQDHPDCCFLSHRNSERFFASEKSDVDGHLSLEFVW